MKHARFTPAAVVELEDAARRVDRARPGWGGAKGWGDKLNDEVLEALGRIEEYVEGWQTFDERGPERLSACAVRAVRGGTSMASRVQPRAVARTRAMEPGSYDQAIDPCGRLTVRARIAAVQGGRVQT